VLPFGIIAAIVSLNSYRIHGAKTMKHGSLNDGAGQLKMAADKFEEAWEAARPVWDDIVSRTMQEEQIGPLMDQLRATLDAVTRMNSILMVACRECEDERQAS
jgi:hypothetical protein